MRPRAGLLGEAAPHIAHGRAPLARGGGRLHSRAQRWNVAASQELSHELQSQVGVEAMDLGQIHAKNPVQRLTGGEAQGIGLLSSATTESPSAMERAHADARQAGED
jgi:hypothetical protein